jgi:hypothetical protein
MNIKINITNQGNRDFKEIQIMLLVKLLDMFL